MRLYLRDSERRPDPAPVKTDDRTAVLAGLGIWLVALVAVLIVTAVGGGSASVIGACSAGVVIGLALLLYTERRRRRS